MAKESSYKLSWQLIEKTNSEKKYKPTWQIISEKTNSKGKYQPSRQSRESEKTATVKRGKDLLGN